MDFINTLREPRIAGVVVADTIATIIGAALLARITKSNFFIILLLLVVLSIVLHFLFDVETTTNKFLMSLTESPGVTDLSLNKPNANSAVTVVSPTSCADTIVTYQRDTDSYQKELNVINL